MRRGRSVGVAAFLLAALLQAAITSRPARAEYVVAPDVVVYCEPTLRAALGDVAERWRAQSGVPVHLFSSPTAAMLEQIGHHARADLIIGESDASADDAARRGIIKGETRHELWRNRLVVAGRKGEDRPGDAASLIAAGRIAVVDPPGSAGESSRRALAALGVWPTAESRAAGTVDTADAAFLLREGRVAHAVLLATDVARSPALAVAAPLPEDAYPPVRYWIAEAANVLSPNAGDFAAFLRQRPAQEIARAQGLEVLP
jgi:molybdate transport system substrate-binding protein